MRVAGFGGRKILTTPKKRRARIVPFDYWRSPRTRPTSANLCRWVIDHYEIPGGQPDWWGFLQDRSAALGLASRARLGLVGGFFPLSLSLSPPGD